jgi:hypothetical protein
VEERASDFVAAVPFGAKAFVTVSFYFYGDKAAAAVARDQSAWTAWMTNLFPA